MPARLVLRHSIVPYRTLGTFFLGLMVWGLVVAYQTKKWGAFSGAALLAAVYSLLIAQGLWYRIWLSDGVIWQRAYGRPRVAIRMSEITSVGREISDLRTTAAMNRPFRRIVITSETPDGRKSIDVSIKHFVAEDIRALMKAIHEARPDLALPKGWA